MSWYAHDITHDIIGINGGYMKKEKIIVIGTNHAGTYAVSTLADNYKDTVDVVTYDANNNISFLGCGMALWIGGGRLILIYCRYATLRFGAV